MTLSPETICVVANPKSGRNSKDKAAIDIAMRAFGPKATLRRWNKNDDLDAFVQKAVADGFLRIAHRGIGVLSITPPVSQSYAKRSWQFVAP